MTSLDAFGRDFLALTLAVDRHIPGYVDAYYGPPELKASIEQEAPPPIPALLDEVARLRESVPGDDPARAAYLQATLRAIEGTLRLKAGEQLDYLEEVRLLYDIQPELVDENRFRAAHAELDRLLIGPGTLDDRLDRWRKQYDIPSNRLLHILSIARDETRKRAAALIELVEGESVEMELVNNQPWSAYNWYKGGARSLIQFNIDIPVSALDVLGLFAHEAYPGHHTEHQLKERYLYHEKGYAEQASALLNAPSAVIAEGIATTAIEVIFKDKRDAVEWTVDVILPEAGLPAALPVDILRINEARRELRFVPGNAAILYHRGQNNAEQTLEYLRSYGLMTEKRARQSFNFITNPLFRSYIFTYTEGYELIARAAHDGDKKPVFRRLLTEQVLPSELAAL